MVCLSACLSLSLPVTRCHSRALSLSLSVWPNELWMGAHVNRYYVQPVCSPTRSSLMTGRYTYRLGTQATVIRADVPFGVPLDNTFIPQNLKDVGYATPPSTPVPLSLPYSLLPRDLPHLGTYIRRITRVYHMTHTDLTGMLQPSLASGI